MNGSRSKLIGISLLALSALQAAHCSNDCDRLARKICEGKDSKECQDLRNGSKEVTECRTRLLAIEAEESMEGAEAEFESIAPK